MDFFAIFLISLIPLEVFLILGRIEFINIDGLYLARAQKAAYVLLSVSLFFYFIYSIRDPENNSRAVPLLLLIGQLSLLSLYVTLYPSFFLSVNGKFSGYETSSWFYIFGAAALLFGVYDIVLRYKSEGATSYLNALFSPVALFGLIIVLKIGATYSPQISADDYHFGEQLLGWWSYLSGSIPYIDYIPAHGLIDDDLGGLISKVFFDGSGGSIIESGRLSFAILGFVAFISIYRFTSSISLAFVITLFLGSRLAWLFFVPFVCLWLSARLRAKPEKWLVIWLLTAPLAILGNPPQGLLLVIAFTFLAVINLVKIWRGLGWFSWCSKYYLALLVILTIAVFFHIPQMLFGAIRYVLENGLDNQTAYGIPWGLSFDKGNFSELIRMSWMAIPALCLLIMKRTYGDKKNEGEIFNISAIIFIFIMLLIPYSMGRVDPQALSRPGLVSIFGWVFLAPILLWKYCNVRNKILVIPLVVIFGSCIGYTTISVEKFNASFSAPSPSLPLKDGLESGLANIGKAHVEDGQWNRLIRLNKLLESKLAPKEPYLDLTSRNSQYFYLNRHPITAVTAPYNMATAAQQMRAVEKIIQFEPKLALIEGENIIHDGGGVSLRNPYLYRYMVEHYNPAYEQGFIVAYPENKGNKIKIPSAKVVAIKEFNDVNWLNGFNRTEPAFIISDPAMIQVLSVGDLIVNANGGARKISRISREGSSIWLEGAPFSSQEMNGLNFFLWQPTEDSAEKYKALLFQKAFSSTDLKKIPGAWGKSIDALKAKMKYFSTLSGESSKEHKVPGDQTLQYQVLSSDPYLTLSSPSKKVSGKDAGLLTFSYSCVDKKNEPIIRVSWWGDRDQAPLEYQSLKFSPLDGVNIIPLDAFPTWLNLSDVKGVKIALENPMACSHSLIKDVNLYQRSFN